MADHTLTPQYYQNVSLPYQNENSCCFHYQNYQQQFEPKTENDYFYDFVYSIPLPSIDASNQHQNYNQESYNHNSQSAQFEHTIQSLIPPYPHQLTPSPSSKTCNQCGYICETSTQLISHLNLTHSTAAPPLCQDFMHRAEGTQIKQLNDTKYILDLDSQEVVVYSKDRKRQNGDSNSHTQYSTTSLIGNWNQYSPIQNQDIHSFHNNVYENMYNQTDLTKMTFGQSQSTSYKSFECLRPQTYPNVIRNSEVPSAPTQAALPMAESRMYNETKKAKTSKGHLKRHNKSTLHENAAATHVMQDMDVNSLNSTSEVHFNSFDSFKATQHPYEIFHNKSESTKTIIIKSKSNAIYCNDCKKSFNTPAYFKQHQKSFHSGAKPYKCTHCGKRFDCENKCKEHNKKHFGEKPYKCEFCPKQFNHKHDLGRHLSSHSGNKPHTCDTCGKGFIRKDHMMKHRKTHNRQPGRNAFGAANED